MLWVLGIQSSPSFNAGKNLNNLSSSYFGGWRLSIVLESNGRSAETCLRCKSFRVDRMKTHFNSQDGSVEQIFPQFGLARSLLWSL